MKTDAPIAVPIGVAGGFAGFFGSNRSAVLCKKQQKVCKKQQQIIFLAFFVGWKIIYRIILPYRTRFLVFFINLLKTGENKMKKKVLAVAIASALVAPSAFAAQDTSGMHFTSASEGFYASIRARYESGANDYAGADIQNASSRFGVRGTNDLGGGLEGFYQYEAGVSIENGSDLSTRLAHVGLRGAFGQLQVGSFWGADYNWTHGSTDIANTASGFFNYTAQRPGRTSRAIEYTSPDLNGFQAAFRVNLANDGKAAVAAKDPITTANADPGVRAPQGGAAAVPADEDANDLDMWNLAAVYSIQGFTVAGAYNTVIEGIDEDNDLDSWTARVGYAQDNWYINAWYGEDNTGDATIPAVGSLPAGTISLDDVETFSIGGGVTVDKVALYALYETQEVSAAAGRVQVKAEDERATIGVQYNIGSQSRLWVEYAARDLDSDETGEDSINIGMRHDF